MPRPQTFRIWRKPNSDNELEYDPPLRSDELHDALKIAYPELKTLKQRIAQANIDFWLRELQEEQHRGSASSSTSSPTQHSTKTSTPTSSPGRTSCRDQTEERDLERQQSAAVQLYKGKQSQKTTTPDSQKKRPISSASDINSHIHVFPLSEAGRSSRHAKKPKTKQQLDAYRTRKQSGACTHHRKRKREVRKVSWIKAKMLTLSVSP